MLNDLWTKIKSTHLTAMILCCAIPIGGIILLSYMNVIASWGYYLIFLLCPLMHIVMMRGMHGSHQKPNLMISSDKTDQNLHI